jgi:hypothetical protein
MRTFTIRTLAMGALATVALAGSATAQSASSSILNALELQTLVASGEPGDNARLSVHFAALAEHYAAEARRHTSMSQGFVGNPNRHLGSDLGVHCKRRAELNTRSALTARELAAYHQMLAVAAPSIPPRDAARFHGGAGAREPTNRELRALAAGARTPDDHFALEEYFLTLAKRHAATANEHAATAQSYRGSKIAQAAVHCDRLVARSRKLADEAIAHAAVHQAFARLVE